MKILHTIIIKTLYGTHEYEWDGGQSDAETVIREFIEQNGLINFNVTFE